jgi:dTDP-4-amino-4,6-dideoxygalactose transaminase
MINLFNINDYQIDTSKFSNLLHDSVVCEFEQAFAEYVGAKYACFANSASSLLFLSLLKYNTTIQLPSTIPSVVPNVVINTGNRIQFYNDINWVGGAYHLHENIFDSAQEVSKNQYKSYDNDNALVIFSFYPTKPVGGCDGGMIVSNNKGAVDWHRMMAMNGTNHSNNNWERKQIAAGYKMNGSSIQAHIAYENLKKLDHKNNRLDEIRGHYNDQLGHNNTSRHLYRIRVANNSRFIDMMKQEGIVCGIHYRHCHDKSFYGFDGPLTASERESEQTVSLPFHEKLSKSDINKVITNVRKLANI